MITIKLLINGEEKQFTAPPPKARMLRQATELKEILNPAELTTAELDLMADFVVRLFENQFTLDDLWDGIPLESFGIDILNCIDALITEMSWRLSKIPNAEAR